MNDKSLECIRFYDIQVNKMVKGRGGVILFTDRGCRLFLECSRNDGFYLRDEAVTKAVSDAGFENVDTYVRNQDGELFTVGDDGHRYVMKNWFGGRECDVKSVNDVMEAVRTLARLHICLNVVSSNGVRYLRNNVNTNITKQWECMALAETADEQPESELKASESIVHNAVHFDRGAGLRTNMERHTKEIKKAANYMRGKKKKNEFEQIALGAVDTFFREADEASRNINSKRFDERFDRMEQTNELVHGSYNYHNVFLDVGNGGNAVTNFEKCHNDCQVADLYQFLRKVMEKHDWNINSKRFDERFDRMEQTNELVHGSYNYHNVFLDVGNGGNAVTNFEKCHNDCQVADLYQFLRKVMEKHDWNINVAYRLVDEYDRLKPLEDDDIDMLVTLLSFPEKFWKIINQYYNAGKAWVPAKNIDKLKIVIEQNMRRRELIDKMCGM